MVDVECVCTSTDISQYKLVEKNTLRRVVYSLLKTTAKCISASWKGRLDKMGKEILPSATATLADFQKKSLDK